MRARRVRPIDGNLVIICGLVAATQMSWGVVIPVMPVYADTLDASITDLGLIISLFGLGRLVANIPAGRLAERLDQRTLLLVSVACVIVCMVASGFVWSIEQLFVLRVLTGIAGGFAITVGNTFIASSTAPSRRGRALGTLHAFQLAGAALGPSLGGIVSATAGPRAAFAASGAVAAVFVVWGTFRLDGSGQRRWDEVPAGPGELLGRTWLLGDASMLAVCVVGFAVFFTRFGGQQFLVPVLAYDHAGLGEAQLGVLLGVIAGTNILLVTFAGWLTDRWGRKVVLVPALLAASVITLGYLRADSTVSFVAVITLTGVLASLSAPAPVAFLADIAPPGRQGSAVGIYRTFGDLAALLGPVVLGLLVDARGTEAAIVTVSAVGLVAGAWFALFARDPRPRRRGAPAPQPEPPAVVRHDP